VDESRGVEHHFERGDEAVGPAAVDELSSAARHGLSLVGVAEESQDGGAEGLGREVVEPAEAGGGALFVEALGTGPVGFGLDDHELGDADAGEFEGGGAAAGEGDMTAGESCGEFGGFADEFELVGMVEFELSRGQVVGVVGRDGEDDAFESGDGEELTGQVEGVSVGVVVAEADEGAAGSGGFLGAERSCPSDLGADQGVARSEEELSAGSEGVGRSRWSEEGVDDEVGGKAQGGGVVEGDDQGAGVSEGLEVVLAGVGGIDQDGGRSESSDVEEGLGEVEGVADGVWSG
jgi:hypothetical protein